MRVAHAAFLKKGRLFSLSGEGGTRSGSPHGKWRTFLPPQKEKGGFFQY